MNTEFKTDGVVNEDNIGEAEVIIKKEVQAALKNLEEY
jgi:hypothetical protein